MTEPADPTGQGPPGPRPGPDPTCGNCGHRSSVHYRDNKGMWNLATCSRCPCNAFVPYRPPLDLQACPSCSDYRDQITQLTAELAELRRAVADELSREGQAMGLDEPPRCRVCDQPIRRSPTGRDSWWHELWSPFGRDWDHDAAPARSAHLDELVRHAAEHGLYESTAEPVEIKRLSEYAEVAEPTGYVIGWRYRETHGNPAREGWRGDWYETRERAYEGLAKWPGNSEVESAVFAVATPSPVVAEQPGGEIPPLDPRAWMTAKEISDAAPIFEVPDQDDEPAYSANLRLPPSGRCGDVLVPLLGAPDMFCALIFGHKGWHKSDTGCEWSMGVRKPEPAAPPVDVRTEAARRLRAAHRVCADSGQEWRAGRMSLTAEWLEDCVGDDPDLAEAVGRALLGLDEGEANRG